MQVFYFILLVYGGLKMLIMHPSHTTNVTSQ